MTDDSLNRRKFVAATGLAAVGALAGCTGNGGDGGGDGNGGDGGDTDTPTPSPTPGGDGGTGGAEDRIETFLTAEPATSNYDGVVDETGKDEVVVEVGAQGNGGNFAFAPPAVKVSSGATVSWQWTGKGSLHNVVSTDDSDFDFDSGDPKESGDPFEQSFDDTGVGLYICEPHKALGMKGAVWVV